MSAISDLESAVALSDWHKASEILDNWVTLFDIRLMNVAEHLFNKKQWSLLKSVLLYMDIDSREQFMCRLVDQQQYGVCVILQLSHYGVSITCREDIVTRLVHRNCWDLIFQFSHYGFSRNLCLWLFKEAVDHEAFHVAVVLSRYGLIGYNGWPKD